VSNLIRLGARRVREQLVEAQSREALDQRVVFRVHPADRRDYVVGQQRHQPVAAVLPRGRDSVMFDITRTKICSGWCGVMSTATQTKCIGGDVVKQKRDACCAGFPPCNRAGLPKCKW
jgi:hypothetical protein